MTAEDLYTALLDRLTPQAVGWLDETIALVATDPAALPRRHPAAGRRCGRGPLGVGAWTVDDAARTLMISAVRLPVADLLAVVTGLYFQGDAAERRAVLRALEFLDLGDGALPLVRDALRTNDTRLVAAALGPYGGLHLDHAAWRDAVLKCLFVGVPLAGVTDLPRRTDAELVRMVRDFARERRAAGRPVPADARLICDIEEN
ncbi:EboA domain-containing protein [Actinocorallia longicatena]|uniref:EboA domain-containing protein n=1 Tax=Actinocorallia longicatena TaxID=111803 RepID=A0ABP6QQG8_9ACTN